MHYLLLTLILTLFTSAYGQQKTLENDLVTVLIKKQLRAEAEPVSKPYEILVNVDCKKPHKNIKKSFSIPICDTSLDDKDFSVNATDIQIVHYGWDAVKSSNNPQGQNYCFNNKKIIEKLKISDFCKL